MSDYNNFLTMISTEFHRYLMENEEFASGMPVNTLVIFQVEGEDDFNKWHKEKSLRNLEKSQPISYVQLKKWRKHSSIEEVKLLKATA